MTANSQTKPAPLGRGLSALFGDADASYKPRTIADVPPATDQGVRKMPTTWLMPGAFQPRRHFDEESLNELASSIRERGIFQPLIVRPLPDAKDSFEIVCGERRWRAAQLAELHDVPVIVRTLSDIEAMEVGLVENIQRQDLSPIEEAEGYHRLSEEFNYTLAELSRIVGKSAPHIGNTIRLLKLPEAVKQMVNEGQLSMGHARCLIVTKNPEQLAREIIKRGMTVRQAEEYANKESGVQTSTKTNRLAKVLDPNIIALENELSRQLGLKTRINARGGVGTITVHFTDLDQLDTVIQKLRG
ncbi:MAG: ParB/RepB/Spo0J family partition protein [Alphaproteobacteria bacterium]|nr:ParB/RepB/Spo0J family partition protein [Alphaproteobacteria bacterium]